MAESLTSIAVKLEQSIGALNTHIAEDTAFHREAMNTLGVVKDDIKSLKQTPMKAVRWLGAIIIAVAALTNIITWWTHEETLAKATQANNIAVVAAASSTQATTKLDRTVKTALGIPTNSTDP